MSAILSADDLNDFITPGVACIKPVETLPAEPDSANPYEVTTEDKVANAAPAQISLTDCLACSGCVTSAEAVLVSLQSHAEVLNTLDEYPSLDLSSLLHSSSLCNGTQSHNNTLPPGKIFVATVSPQARANLAAAYGVTERTAGNMITQLLSGPHGIKSGGKYGSSFTWVLDSNAMREVCLQATIVEALDSAAAPAKPVLASACPGWICYAEKTHPHILPHLSQLKSPQALTGTLVKTVLSKVYGIAPDRIYHVAIMPCFDKKLEASRAELTDVEWAQGSSSSTITPVRDVDTVITARELLMLASSRGLSFAQLPKAPLTSSTPFSDAFTHQFLAQSSLSLRRPTPQSHPKNRRKELEIEAGTSGGYALAVLRAIQLRHAGSIIRSTRGRNADVVEFILEQPSPSFSATSEPASSLTTTSSTTTELHTSESQIIAKTARYYGFRNIQNLVRRLKPARASRLPGSQRRIPPTLQSTTTGTATAPLAEYAYIEVMACPGGCTNGGGQVKASDLAELGHYEHGQQREAEPYGLVGPKDTKKTIGPAEQKAWLARVDEAYFSASSSSDSDYASDTEVDFSNPVPVLEDADDAMEVEEITAQEFIAHWVKITGIPSSKLLYTTFRAVVSDVGKNTPSSSTSDVDMDGISSTLGAGSGTNNGNAKTKKKQSDVQRVAALAATAGGGW